LRSAPLVGLGVIAEKLAGQISREAHATTQLIRGLERNNYLIISLSACKRGVFGLSDEILHLDGEGVSG
jgi:hypothetical protein